MIQHVSDVPPVIGSMIDQMNENFSDGHSPFSTIEERESAFLIQTVSIRISLDQPIVHF